MITFIKQQSSWYQMRTQWLALAKELNLKADFKSKPSYWFKTILKPSISGVIDGFHLNITLKKTGLLAKNSIECSVQIKNPNFLNFTILSKKKIDVATALLSEQEVFNANFKISTNTPKDLDKVLSPKIRTSILKLTNKEQGTTIKLSSKTSSVDNEALILDSNEKSSLSFLVKEILFVRYSDKNQIKDTVSLLLQLAKKIEHLK